MKKTYCDGCHEELDSAPVRAMEVEHTFGTGHTFRAKVSFASDVNRQIMTYGDGDLCDDCALAILQEGFPVP